MVAQLTMPEGGEWLVILAVVVIIFGSSKLPQLARSLAKSKRVWDEEIRTGNRADAELTHGSQQAPVDQPGAGAVRSDDQPPTHTATDA